ncbi:S1C family serine protease [Thermoflavimicrobium dichotomicum]|uniref:Serine protease Do n=1 Tax=Thermoflavimicrobium dichotomicum TaxID=46223 RepID=A0A1I3NBP2_9BACL|nr:trypsin-like peptidase domain-containing protein [Thermoflavimicrobium dichotomicum]SFJ06196.1 serine protease Do [Thermoflavimicrobium dichotomicum]
MGFYDQTEPSNSKRQPSPILIAIVSAVIGGLIVLLFTPALVRSGVIPLSADQPALAGPTATVKVNSDITKAVEKVRPAVVGIESVRKTGDLFSREENQSGSGIIFERRNGKALVVTNHHVIENGRDIRVTISNNDTPKTVTAKVLGSDKITDLAVLEIDDKYVTAVASFGNSDALKAGEPAIAIGNPLGQTFSQSVTVGVISSPKRTFQANEYVATDVIQTDAAISPGNSGGALVNAAGQVIGINTLKIAEQGVEGLGFAIPVNLARPIIRDLINKGHVPRPYIGVSFLGDLYQFSDFERETLKLPADVEDGVVVGSVQPDSPAAKARLQRLDVIVAINGNPVQTVVDFRSYLYSKTKIGDKITITFYRDGKKQTADLTLTEAPASLLK